MEKLKNVGTGPVSAQKEVIDDCPEFSKRNKQKAHGMHSAYPNFNGITLIALIITVIVMLILVGVTISVALNGGLFETATKAATETQREAEKEQLLSAVVGAIGTDGKVDSTKISLPEGFQKDDSKSTGTKLVVKGKDTLWQIDLISAKVEPYGAGDTYTFTIRELGKRGLLNGDESGSSLIQSKDFWKEGVSEKLKNSTITVTDSEGQIYETYNITCSEPSIANMLTNPNFEQENYTGAFGIERLSNGDILFLCVYGQTSEGIITNENYEQYPDISFTISMAE